jgi:lambda family phage portal protein
MSARDIASWIPPQGSADTDLLDDLPQLVYRSRDIHRNNGIAHGGIQTIVDNVVGTGMRLSARPDYTALGKTKEWAAQWAVVTQALYHSWWWSTACHAGDTLTGDQLTALTMASGLTNGEALTLPVWVPNRGDGYATKLQLVESDRLCNPPVEPETRLFHGGIEFDSQYGMPLYYNIRKIHPGERFFDPTEPMAQFDSVRIPRRTSWGRLRVIHTFDTERNGQTRGKPLLSAVLPQFKNIDRYAQAELQAAVANAMIAGIITTPLDQENIVELFRNDAEKYMQMRQDAAVKLSSGSMIPLFPGDSMQSFLPQRPAAQFGAFVENIYRIIGVGLDLPYELLLKDFSKTNYSSARAALLEAWRSFMRRRDWLGTMWLDPIYGLFLEEMVNAGRIDAPGFYENRSAYCRCKWIGPGRGWVDPVKEAQAAQLRIDAGLSTAEDECAEQGKDWEEVYEQLAREQQRRAELKLADHSAVRAANPPASNNPDQQQQQATAQP